jgi:hypothetical protein
VAYTANDSGGIDIARAGDNDPTYARSAADIQAEVNQRVNQNRRGPEAGAPVEAPARKGGNTDPQPEAADAKQSANPMGDFFGGLGSGLSGLWNQRPFQEQHSNPFSPVDWAKMQADDAWMAYQVGRKSYDALTSFFNPDGGPYQNSIHNYWEQDDAWHRFSQILGSNLVKSTVPLAHLPQVPAELGMAKDVLTGKAGPDQAAAQQRKAEEQDVEQLPAGLAETAQVGVMPEGALGKAAAFIGIPAARAGLESNPDDMARNVAWAALTGMILGGGHIPEGMREPLSKAFGKWPEVETFVRGLLKTQKQGARNAADPNSTHVQDYISQQLARGGFPGSEKVIAAQRKGEQTLSFVRDAEGNLIQKRDQRKREALKALKKFGVKSVADVIHDAEDGNITGQYAKRVADNWKGLGLPYDLEAHYAPDDPLRDPRRSLLEIHNSGNEVLGDWAHEHLDSVHHMLHQVQTGVFSSEGSPMQAVLRSLAGLHQGTKYVVDRYLKTGTALLGQSGVTGRQLIKAVEDKGTYDALPPEARMWVDSWRLISNSLRTQAKDTPYAEHFVGNYFPRIEQLGERAFQGAGPILRGANKRHRGIQIGRDPASGQLVASPQYNTLEEAAKDRQTSRANFLERITDPLKDVPGSFKRDPEVKRLRELLGSNPEEAKAGLEKIAKAAYPDLEQNPFKTIERYLHRQVSAIHSHQALQQLENLHIKADPKTGLGGPAAIAKSTDTRLMKTLMDRGYQDIDNFRLQNHLVHPKLADALGRYINHVDNAKGLRGNVFFRKALELERESLGLIMFSPAIHGLNMAGRLGFAGLMNPLEMTHYLLNRKGLTPHQMDRASFELRREAFNAGFMPHAGGHGYMKNLTNAMHDAWGDTGDQMAEEAQAPEGKLRGLLHGVKTWKDPVDDYFWKQINDFGVMMYHLEKKSAQRHGLSEEESRLWAARRANSWAGIVQPEDTNPVVHDLMRTAFFAPNWWRTWAELMVPIYRRSGIEMTPQMVRMAAYQGAKTIAAAVAFQKLTGNALNMLFSGHLQKDNLPGNQDKIELTAPWLDDFSHLDLSGNGIVPMVPGTQAGLALGSATQDLLKASPAAGPHGGRRSIENPLGRFQRDIEGAAGLQSGHPDWQSGDLSDGMSKFLVSRLSPVVDGAAALTNVDLYRSATSQPLQARAIDPDRGAGSLSWQNAVYAAIYLSPMGSQLADQVARATSQGQDPNQQVPGPFGTKMPKSWDSILKSTGSSLEKGLFSWMTGVNPPYDYAQRSRGQTPSDVDYQHAREYQQQYRSEMGKASAKALGGVTPPNEWLTNYHKLSQQHHDRMEALYKNAPYYVNGPDGMIHDYEALAQEATAPDGSVDLNKLHHLQGEFRQKHSAEELQAMDQLLGQNDQRYPMLKLYHQTMGAYGKWQEQWASQNGVDIGTLRQEISEYGALYGQSAESRRYLAQHRELARYEQAKRRQWESSPAGLMYGLFYNSSTVARYMQAHHLNTPEGRLQVEQAAEQQMGVTQ